MLDQHRREHHSSQRSTPALSAREQAIDQQPQPAFELHARCRLWKLERLSHQLARRARTQGPVTAARELEGKQARRSEPVGERGRRERRQLSERADAETLERLGHVHQRGSGAQQRHRHRCQEVARLHAVTPDDHRAAHPRSRRRRNGGEPRRRDTVTSGHAESAARRGQHSLDPAVQPQQPARVEAHQSGSLGLDSCADRLQTHQQPLPHVGDTGRIWWDQRQLRTAGKCLPHAHPRVDAKRLRG